MFSLLDPADYENEVNPAWANDNMGQSYLSGPILKQEMLYSRKSTEHYSGIKGTKNYLRIQLMDGKLFSTSSPV